MSLLPTACLYPRNYICLLNPFVCLSHHLLRLPRPNPVSLNIERSFLKRIEADVAGTIAHTFPHSRSTSLHANDSASNYPCLYLSGASRAPLPVLQLETIADIPSHCHPDATPLPAA